MPSLFAILAVIFMFLDFYNPYLKLGTVVLCVIAAYSFYHEFTLTEKKMSLACSFIWIVNSLVHSFLFYKLITQS